MLKIVHPQGLHINHRQFQHYSSSTQFPTLPHVPGMPGVRCQRRSKRSSPWGSRQILVTFFWGFGGCMGQGLHEDWRVPGFLVGGCCGLLNPLGWPFECMVSRNIWAPFLGLKKARGFSCIEATGVCGFGSFGLQCAHACCALFQHLIVRVLGISSGFWV